jgi:hypothetical protein
MLCKIISFFVVLCFPLFVFATDMFYVGDLGKQWNFGSDHLPIGITVNGHHFVSWNILDKRFIHWIETNEQGLKGSAITDNHVPLRPGESLTLREELIIRQILAMATHPTHPRSILALQETNPDVFQELSKRLPSKYVAISHQSANQGEVLFYDKTFFNLKNCDSGVYTNAKNTWVVASLQDIKTHATYTIVHSHIPGGNKSEDARRQLARHIFMSFNPNNITLIMGDQNRAPSYFLEDLNKVFKINPFNLSFGLSSSDSEDFTQQIPRDASKVPEAEEEKPKTQVFKIVDIPYPTHVNTHKEACWIDNFFTTHPAICRVGRNHQEFFNALEVPLLLFQKYQPK